MSAIQPRRIRITFIFTHHIRWVPFELTATMIDRNKFDIDYVILGRSDPIIDFLKSNDIPVTITHFDGYKNVPEAVKFVYDHLVQNKTDIVQTHWFAGSLIGQQAAYYANVPVRIFHREHPPLEYYTRHPETKHRLIWECCTHVIAVTNKSKAGMVEDGIPAEKISVIPTGFNINDFEKVNSSSISRLRNKYLNQKGLQDRYPIIGVAARYVKWKGVEYTINAIKKVLEFYPDTLLILSGGHINRNELRQKLAKASQDDVVAPQYADAINIIECTEQLPANSYIEIPFEEDLFSLFKLFDIFVHAPINSIQETFGQVYVEAMLARVPSVITLSGSAIDHAIHRENAWVVDYENSDEIAEGILALLADNKLRQSIVKNAFKCAKDRYSITPLIRKLEQFYIDCFNHELNCDS